MIRATPARIRPVSHPDPADAGASGTDVYNIRVAGRLDERWSSWFDGFLVSAGEDGSTSLTGPVTDQAALHGLLTRVRDLGLELISVRRVT